MNSCEAKINPNNKKQKKELEFQIEKLGLKTQGEIFVLNCVLSLDWERRKIVQSIKYIKERENGAIDFHITLTAPSLTTHYSTFSPFITSGVYKSTLEERMWGVYRDMDYYTKP